LQASIRSAANMARASWIAGGSSGTNVNMDGASVTVSSSTGWPRLTSIKSALQDTGDFTETSTGSGSFTKSSGSCTVTVNYDEATGNAGVSQTAGCNS